MPQALLPAAAVAGSQAALHTTAAQPAGGQQWWKYAAGVGAAGLAGLGLLSTVALADESEHGLHPVDYPWDHAGFFSAYDHRAIRRGFQVYQQVGGCWESAREEPTASRVAGAELELCCAGGARGWRVRWHARGGGAAAAGTAAAATACW